MRKFFTLKCLLFAFVLILTGAKVSGQVNHLVISQVYGGGGNAGAIYQNDFIEIYNPTGATVFLTNWSVQYASTSGSTWAVTNLSGSIAPGKYYLVKQAAGAGNGSALPTADAIGSVAMAAGAGKVILSNSITAFTGSCPSGASVIDLVGYGSGTTCFETSVTGTLANATAAIRKNNGCTDTDNNGSDFAVSTPTPRNSSTAANTCTFPPTVITTTVTGVNLSAASSGGNVTADGSNAVTARGVVWDLVTAPTTVLTSKTSDGTGLGAFTSTLVPLVANTKYFYRAYATNGVGTSYGTESNFTTLSNPPVTGSGSNPSANGFTANWSAPTGNGGAVYTYTIEVDDDNAFGSIDISQSNIPSSAVSLAVAGLSSSTIYYYRVKAVNTTGSSAYSATSVGIQTLAAATPTFTLVSPLGGIAFGNICVNNTTPDVSFTIDGSNLNGTNITIAAIPGLSFSETSVGTYTSTLSFSAGAIVSGKQIFVKFNPTNAQSYDGNIIVSGGGASDLSIPVSASGINTIPSAVTSAPIVTGTAATLSGSISVTGCSTVTSFGFEYSTTTGFANGSGISVTASGLNSGSFSKTVSGLTAGVTYYYHAFAVNNGGTGYGAQQSFTTSAVTPVIISAQPLLRYTENFGAIAGWSANFTSGTGANRFSSTLVSSTGTIPGATAITTPSDVFSSGSSGGVQKGTGSLVLLSTGSTNNTSSVAVDFYMDFTGVNAGTLSFDWATINNSLSTEGGDNRAASLRVYASNDGVSFTEIASVLNFVNGTPSSGILSVSLPASFSNSPTARLRFYYHNGTGGSKGSRPKLSIDNLIVTGVASTPCTTPSAAPTSLTFGTITETSIQGSFVAASPAANEYLVVMSTNSTLTSNPLDGQSYVIGDNMGDGTVIAKGNELNFTATDLTGATTYYFFVFSVNSVCTGGPKYQTTDALTDDATTVAGLPNCSAPLTQATDLTLTASTNSIQGTFTAATADEYLVLQSSSSSLSNMPVNSVVYNAGAILGNATVVQRNNATTFTASGLTPATQYYYYIFSINSQACLNGPVYNTVAALSGTASTQPLPVCVTPTAQPANISFNSSNNSITATFNAGGSGYNYLVVMSSSPTLSATPVDNIDYAAGSSLGGGTVISNATSTSFIATSLTNSTTYYFFVFSANKNCTGGTKYLVASPLTGNATTTNAPVNNYYFGNLHSHSDYSDGQKDHPGGTPADAYVYASASQGMDFLGVSEHNHFSSLNNPGNELANYHLGVAQAAAFNATHSNFLALYGMEWGVISGGGHVLVYGDGMNDLFGWESNVNGNVGPNYDVYVPKNTYLGVEGLFKKVNDYVAKNTFASLAHPNNTDFNNLSNIAYDQSADDAISGVAVESGPATSTNTTYSNPSTMNSLWYYNKLLSKGYHLGPMIDHDNHNTTFGRHTAARTAVIAPSLTQSDIIKGVKDMHFYATEDMDAKVDFTINTRIMGSIFEDRNAPSIAVNLTDATNNTSGALIRVMFGKPGSNITPVVVDSVFASSLSYVDNNLANHETGYYYIDISYEGKRIVTSPIWYTRTCASSSETTVTACNSYDWYGTLYTTSTVATKVFTTVGGCDSTVTLHLTINSSPLSATIATVGSDNGCPGTGVALTATADGNISSYQWLQNGNVIATTAAGSYTALATGSYSVTATNLNNCSVVSANTISVTVEDNTVPVPDVATLPVVSGQCSATVSSAPTATDNCAGTITATTTDALTYSAQGTYTIHWIYNDGNGNSTTQEQTVIVSDTEKPTITAPSVTVNNDVNNCGANVTVAVPETQDNCGVQGVINNYNGTTNASGYYPVGTTNVTWTVTDIHGNTETLVQQITVRDVTAPVITVPADISVVCSPTITPAVTGMATGTDNCTAPSISYSDVVSSNGLQITRTWKATDVAGNFTTGVQVITLIPLSVSIASVPTSNVFTGGVATNLYIGYGAQSTVLQVNDYNQPVAGAPYTYSWSGANLSQLSSTSSSAPLFTVGNASGYYTYTVTVTNRYGCSTTTTISLCVTDVRVAGSNGKVYVCHLPGGNPGNRQTLSVSVNAVNAHLTGHTGDKLGSCDVAPCTTPALLSTTPVVTAIPKGAQAEMATTEEELKVTVMPNPSTTFFTLKLESKYETPVNMRVMDSRGRVVDARSKLGSNSTIQIGQNYAGGVYYAEMIQRGVKRVVQLIKQK